MQPNTKQQRCYAEPFRSCEYEQPNFACDEDGECIIEGKFLYNIRVPSAATAVHAILPQSVDSRAVSSDRIEVVYDGSPGEFLMMMIATICKNRSQFRTSAFVLDGAALGASVDLTPFFTTKPCGVGLPLTSGDPQQDPKAELVLIWDAAILATLVQAATPPVPGVAPAVPAGPARATHAHFVSIAAVKAGITEFFTGAGGPGVWNQPGLGWQVGQNKPDTFSKNFPGPGAGEVTNGAIANMVQLRAHPDWAWLRNSRSLRVLVGCNTGLGQLVELTELLN
eukprot:TRINITY_DN61554_c0_g1_i3.p1 TRINITY_DN61554_c0_g1~~TRINITY_DN61554_c0_g1_i3.p1  ORF type:complete len:281 (-),score=29.74 TRINITY_DN61554_c0_g1_i3:50-892(-)